MAPTSAAALAREIIWCIYIDAPNYLVHSNSMENAPVLEWDESKRQETLAKRGVDFADFALMDFDTAKTRKDPRHDEVRFVTFGLIGGRLHVSAWCQRGDNIRIISLRKANARERNDYDRT